MKTIFSKRLFVLAFAFVTLSVQAQKTIVDLAVGSSDHTTLVAALKAGELVEALQGDGPFTVFAPTNAAFEKVDAATLESLLQPENQKQLQNILTYHVVSGNLDSKAVVGAIQKGNGTAELEALNGNKLTAMAKDGSVYLMDEKGGKAKVTTVDLKGSNGVIHVIDTVLMPDNKE